MIKNLRPSSGFPVALRLYDELTAVYYFSFTCGLPTAFLATGSGCGHCYRPAYDAPPRQRMEQMIDATSKY